MERAYVLIETETGRGREVAGLCAQIPGVVSVDAAAGPYDVILSLEAEGTEGIQRLIDRIHELGGLVRTTTCFVLSGVGAAPGGRSA